MGTASALRWGGLRATCASRWARIREKLEKGHLRERMLKNTLCTTIVLIIGILPPVVDVFGTSTYLAAMLSVFGYPGRRFGVMMEVLILILLGVFVGLAWSCLGLYLSALVVESNESAAYGIRAVFFSLALLLHGILRSSTPRLFMFVFFMLLICLTVLSSTAQQVSAALVTNILYPILTAAGAVVAVNVLVFPEFSGRAVGKSVIETLWDTALTLESAGAWFMSDCQETNRIATGEDLASDLRTKLVLLTDKKDALRSKLAGTKNALMECRFEAVYSVLPPNLLKGTTGKPLTRLVQNTISIINSCESKYALAGLAEEDSDTGKDDSGEEEDPRSDSSSSDDDSSSSSDDNSPTTPITPGKRRGNPRRKSRHVRNLELIKPTREIESGDFVLLEHILSQVRMPAKVLLDEIREALQVITNSLAYCYNVPKLPSGARSPPEITLEEIDAKIASFAHAATVFDENRTHALEQAAAMSYGADKKTQADIMPRMETFLISSYLVTLQSAANQMMDMLNSSRDLVDKRRYRRGRKRLYFPHISWKKWLRSGGESDGNVLPGNARKEVRTGRGKGDKAVHEEDTTPKDGQTYHHPKDEEVGETTSTPEKDKGSRGKGPQTTTEKSALLRLRGMASDGIEYIVNSDDLAFALKMSIAGWLITWPGFVPSLNAWYASIRGSWASLNLIIVFEVSIGTTFQGFLYRVFGVIFGCVVGFLAYLIGQGNRIVAIVVLVIGIIPSTYVQLATPYVKTGIISMVSMSVVALATIIKPDPLMWEIFVKRLVCFLIGGTVALLAELMIFPVRARDRLVECLAACMRQISNMENSLAIGIDNPVGHDVNPRDPNRKFKQAKNKAGAALGAARTFHPFTLLEPRLKGSFEGQALIYKEMIYVLSQIIDRMDNMLHLREVYGSTVLEELNEQVLPYRRNVAASITLTLFAVHEALTTRLPLPQFLPSTRVAQLRYVCRVKEAMAERVEMSRPVSRAASYTAASYDHLHGRLTPLDKDMVEAFTKQNFLSWNATSAGMMEVIEYLEELVDLAKLLVGVNAFRSGMLERPKFYEYIKKIKAREVASASAAAAEAEHEHEVERTKSKGSGVGGILRRRRAYSSGNRDAAAAAAGLRRWPTFGASQTGGQDGAADLDEKAASGVGVGVGDGLPLSLQRIKTKRKEEQETERLRRASTADLKGKGKLRGAKTWQI